MRITTDLLHKHKMIGKVRGFRDNEDVTDIAIWVDVEKNEGLLIKPDSSGVHVVKGNYTTDPPYEELKPIFEESKWL